MWKLMDVHAIDKKGELELIRLDESGNQTSERLVLPVMLKPGYDWSMSPLTMEDQEVYRLIMEIADNLVQDMAIASGDFDGWCEPEQPRFIINTITEEPKPDQPAKIVGRIDL